jgi:hypothetical protein
MAALRKVLIVGLVVVLAVGHSVYATAQSEPSSPDYLQSMEQAYLRAYPELSPTEAHTAVVNQESRLKLLEMVGGDPNYADFGGSWYDPKTDTMNVYALLRSWQRTSRSWLTILA